GIAMCHEGNDEGLALQSGGGQNGCPVPSHSFGVVTATEAQVQIRIGRGDARIRFRRRSVWISAVCETRLHEALPFREGLVEKGGRFLHTSRITRVASSANSPDACTDPPRNSALARMRESIRAAGCSGPEPMASSFSGSTPNMAPLTP